MVGRGNVHQPRRRGQVIIKPPGDGAADVRSRVFAFAPEASYVECREPPRRLWRRRLSNQSCATPRRSPRAGISASVGLPRVVSRDFHRSELSSIDKTSESQRIIDRSITFCSSRMFPGQPYASRSAAVLSGILGIAFRSRRAWRSTNSLASGRMSSLVPQARHSEFREARDSRSRVRLRGCASPEYRTTAPTRLREA